MISLPSMAQQDTLYPRFSPAQLRQDLDSLYQQLQDNHPDLYANWPKSEADAAFEQAARSLIGEMTRAEFRRLLFPLVARFRDGHTYMEVALEGEDLSRYVAAGGTFFPLRVVIIGQQLFCLEDPYARGSLQKGDEILSIHGVPAAKIISYIRELWSADGEASAVATAQRLFSYGLYLGYGWGRDTPIEYLHNGKAEKAVLKGINRDAFFNLTFQQGTTSRILHLFPGESLAVVEINSYNQTSRATAFIDSCFAVIREQGIRNVVLDLRRNGGGNSFIGDYFLGYVNRKPYGMIREKRWRVGPLVRSLPADHWLSASLQQDRKTYKEKGQYVQSANMGERKPVKVKEPALIADVRFFLFTSRRTYSSAHMTALAVKCGGLGTIIGQPTGERLDLTGEILEYKLPHTGLTLVVPTADYKAACGDGRQVGVNPDIEVPVSIEDIRSGRDAELEVVRKLLKKEQ